MNHPKEVPVYAQAIPSERFLGHALNILKADDEKIMIIVFRKVNERGSKLFYLLAPLTVE